MKWAPTIPPIWKTTFLTLPLDQNQLNLVPLLILSLFPCSYSVNTMAISFTLNIDALMQQAFRKLKIVPQISQVSKLFRRLGAP